MTNEAAAEAQWFVRELTLAVLKAAVPDGEQEDTINAVPHSLTHLACACPASSQHLFDQSEFSERKKKIKKQIKTCTTLTV